MANVSFKFGTRQQYEALEIKDQYTLYWILDTQELYRGADLFGVGKEATEKASGLLSAEDKANLDRLVKTGITELAPVDGSITVETVGGTSKIGVAISQEDDNIITVKDDGVFASSATYTIEKQPESADGYAATYRLKKTVNGESEAIGDEINIPKDLVLQNGTFEVVEDEDSPYDGAEVGDPYIDLVLNDPNNTHIYIPLKGLVDTVTAGQGISVENNAVSVALNAVNKNGLELTGDGLGLSLATKETAGAMSAVDKKFLDAIPAVYNKVKYDFFSLPEGTLVKNNGNEYRIMFPANTAWKKQNGDSSNANYKPENYYFAMRAYAPNDSVVGFKEDTSEIIDDPKLYHFTADEFGGVDEYGRKYSVVWLPAAKYDSDSDTWTYHGSASGNGKYKGWYYSVDWYDESGKVVASDTIRINLTNEDCHNSLTPFYMSDYVKTEDIKDIEASLVWSEM